MTTFLLVLAWLLCGVLAALLDARWSPRYNRVPLVIVLLLPPIALFTVCLARLVEGPDLLADWLDRYAERHRRDK